MLGPSSNTIKSFDSGTSKVLQIGKKFNNYGCLVLQIQIVLKPGKHFGNLPLMFRFFICHISPCAIK